jgi:uncharacterized protein YecT (DUF1311 family)
MRQCLMMAVVVAGCVVALSHAARAQGGKPPECSGTPAAIGACLDEQIKAEKATLDQLYSAALARAPVQDPTDARRSRAQLGKAEAAWADYVEANCAYVGGIEGGSNSWISVFAATCVRDAYLRRIEFFRHPPSQV